MLNQIGMPGRPHTHPLSNSRKTRLKPRWGFRTGPVVVTQLPVRVRLHKLDDEQHELELCGPAERYEVVRCETRSYLLHDLIHFALESAAGLEDGFWGQVASGVTLDDMKARAIRAATDPDPTELGVIEKVVGMLQTMSKTDMSADQMVKRLEDYARAQEAEIPSWANEPTFRQALENLRQLRGRWKATSFGEVMELRWPLR